MNSSTGFLLAIEGVDGTGKRTQVTALQSIFENAGREVAVYGFPDYDHSFLGSTVRAMLMDKLGDAKAIHPTFSAALFALERSEKARQIRADLAAGKLVICDRYVYSNVAHQACRLPASEQLEFQKWVEHLEFETLGMPRADATVLLEVDEAEAERRRISRSEQAQGARPLDAYESDTAGLATARTIYSQLAQRLGWLNVEAFGGPPEEITARVLRALSPVLAP